MKGKNTFTQFEIEKLKELIKQKGRSQRSEQKSIRDKMRAIGFYITDFTDIKGFTVIDFENLIRNGRIRISD